MSAYFWLRDLLSRSHVGPLQSLALSPLALSSLAWSSVLRARRALYRKGILPSAHPGVPTLCVGNLTVGGTGKTPLVEEICRILLDMGHRPAIVSRGYGRKRAADVLVVSDGKGAILDDPGKVGDEPLLLARHLPAVPVVVGADRARAAREAVRLGATVVVTDDGFQHLRLARDANIVVLDAREPFGNGWTLPRGLLREPPAALADADLILLTRSRGVDLDACKALLARYAPGVPVLAAEHGHEELREWPEGARRGLCALEGCKALAFAGIGKPEAFFADLERLGANLVEYAPFPDHHAYARREVDVLLNRARLANAELLITTEKDAMRLTGLLPLSLPLCVLPLRLRMEEGDLLALKGFLARWAGKEGRS